MLDCYTDHIVRPGLPVKTFFRRGSFREGRGRSFVARILVVDDVEEVRWFLRIILRQAGHEVVEAPDGAQALQVYQQQPADLVLCDLFMPEKEGLETIRELRGRHAGAKIIAISGGCPSASVDFLPLARKFGAAAALHKPFNARQLLAAVAEVLSGADPAVLDTP
jgi:CheY-like chemotaxis protein